MAAAPWHQLSFDPPSPEPGQAFSMTLSGSMPDTCGVRFDGIEFNGSSVHVRLSRPEGAQICGQAITPYRIDIDASTAIGTFNVSGHYPVYVEITDSAGSRDIAFALLSVAERNRGKLPDAGFWVADPAGRHATGGSGVGFNIERQADALALIAYYYDLQGQPRWYFSAGPGSTSSYRGQLLEITGGQQLFGLYRPPGDMQAFANIDVGFDNQGRAEAWLSQPLDGGVLSEVQVQAVSLVRFGFRTQANADGLAGRWVLVDLGRESGSGTIVNLEAAPTLGSNHARAMDPRTAVVVDCGIISEQLDQPTRSCSLSVDGSRAATLDNNSFDELRSPDGNFRLIRLD